MIMSVCLERHFVIKDVSVEEVIHACNKILREMDLKIVEEVTSQRGLTTILAGEGALVPLITSALLNPLGLDDYLQTAQRTGIHVVISPEKHGVNLYVCGVAFDEIRGKKKHTKEEVMEEVTETIESWHFEDRFTKKMCVVFPNMQEMN